MRMYYVHEWASVCILRSNCWCNITHQCSSTVVIFTRLCAAATSVAVYALANIYLPIDKRLPRMKFMALYIDIKYVFESSNSKYIEWLYIHRRTINKIHFAEINKKDTPDIYMECNAVPIHNMVVCTTTRWHITHSNESQIAKTAYNNTQYKRISKMNAIGNIMKRVRRSKTNQQMVFYCQTIKKEQWKFFSSNPKQNFVSFISCCKINKI